MTAGADGLRLGKKTEQPYADAEKLHKQLDRYAHGPPPIRFTDEDVDQARAVGVLIEFDGSGPADHRRPPVPPRARRQRRGVGGAARPRWRAAAACEEFSRFLDRGVLIGTLEDPSLAFFNGRAA